MIPGTLPRLMRRPMYSSVLKTVTTYPPLNPYISETAFSHRLQKAYTYPPPPTERSFGALDQNMRNP